MKRRPWKRDELKLLKYCYEDTPTPELAFLLDRPLSSVYQAARKLGLSKSRECIADMARERMLRQDHGGRAHRFGKGHVPANKGLRRPGWAPGRMGDTQFKAGQRGITYAPIGTERISKDGYLERKVTDEKRSPRDWRSVHALLWEEHNGPIPPGHVVVFKDADKQNIVLDNLELITRAELMHRNSSHRWGPEVFQLIQLRGALNRKIRSRNEKQDVRPSQSSVRSAGEAAGR